MSKQQTEVNILRSLLTQVVAIADDETVALVSLNINEPNKATRISSLCEAFSQVCSRPTNMVLVLDAVDELDNPSRLLSWLRAFADSGCKILVTSRDHPDIRKSLSTALTMDVSAAGDDLVQYVLHRFGESDFCDAVTKDHYLIDAIVEKANGL